MPGEAIDQAARDGILVLQGEMKLTTSQISEARNDIARLDEAFTKSGDERRSQFRWLVGLIVTVILGVMSMALALILHR